MPSPPTIRPRKDCMPQALGLLMTLVLLCAVGLSPAQAQAQDCPLAIPHITGGDDAWRDVLQVGNVTAELATFTLQLYAQGQPVYQGVIEVPGYGVQEVDLKALAAGATTGIITGCGPELSFRMSYENQLGAVAEFELAGQTAGELAFLFSNFAASMQWKGLAVMNSGSGVIQCSLQAQGGGKVLGTVQRQIGPHSRVQGTVQALFPGLNAAAIERVVATSASSELAGLSISGSYASPILLFSPAVDLAEPACDPLLPHLTGSDAAWDDLLEVDNTTGQTRSFSLSLSNQGQPVYSGAFQVGPLGYSAIDLSQLAPTATTGEISSCTAGLAFRVAYRNTQGGVASFDLGNQTPRSTVGAFFPGFADFVQWRGLAVLNTGSGARDVTLTALGDGQVLGTRQDSVLSMARLVGSVADLFPGVDQSNVDMVLVSGNDPDLVGLAISGSFAQPTLLFAPAPQADAYDGGTAVNGELVVLAWNDLGMHCLNPTYDQAVILPPYNTLWAQVIRRGNPPQVLTDNLTVEYRILDNTFSSGKRDYGQFWEFDTALFGVDLPLNKGLNLPHPSVHLGLRGAMLPEGDHFQADGIPLTPVHDDGTWDPYQVAEVTVRDTAGRVLASTRATVPTSDEINCAKCHGDGSIQSAFANILAVHQPNLSDMAPVLCAACHGSPALGTPPGDRGTSGMYLSEAIHGFHANKGAACYDCHPGNTTQCSRSLAHSAGGGNCETCHGTMAQLAQQITSGQKIPWVDEPKCVSCHPVDGVDTGQTLYRNARGHGQLSCPACHQSPHALIPSREDADNYQAMTLQNSPTSLGNCRPCHSNSRGPGEGLGEFAEEHGGTNPERRNNCHICHTVVSTNTAAWPHGFAWQGRSR